MSKFWETASPEVGSRAVLLIPVGSTEQHGPHLPLTTDTNIALELCERAATSLDNVYVSSPMPFGASGEHQDFPGTLSIGTETLYLVILELGRSARHSFGLTIFVNAHGGNVEAMNAASARLNYEKHPVVTWNAPLMGDLHAGETETSIMMHLAPAQVRTHLLETGNMEPPHKVLPILFEHGMRAVSENGVLGDPTAASAEQGETLLDAAALALVTFIKAQELESQF
ncbi:MAG: mycofactocin biosynthesis peptidyl-dipeptidase MftE [Candidatus Nanopelagicales bacterium]